MLDTKIMDHTLFGISIMDVRGDDGVEAWIGTQSSNHLMALKLGAKELCDVSAEDIRGLISELQRAVSANQKQRKHR